MTPNIPHPEAQPGEVWLFNVSPGYYLNCSYATKRLGENAYGRAGQRIAILKPLFVQQYELDAKGLPYPTSMSSRDAFVLEWMRRHKQNKQGS
jgi:hypothetical protein